MAQNLVRSIKFAYQKSQRQSRSKYLARSCWKFFQFRLFFMPSSLFLLTLLTFLELYEWQTKVFLIVDICEWLLFLTLVAVASAHFAGSPI